MQGTLQQRFRRAVPAAMLGDRAARGARLLAERPGEPPSRSSAAPSLAFRPRPPSSFTNTCSPLRSPPSSPASAAPQRGCARSPCSRSLRPSRRSRVHRRARRGGATKAAGRTPDTHTRIACRSAMPPPAPPERAREARCSLPHPSSLPCAPRGRPRGPPRARARRTSADAASADAGGSGPAAAGQSGCSATRSRARCGRQPGVCRVERAERHQADTPPSSPSHDRVISEDGRIQRAACRSPSLRFRS